MRTWEILEHRRVAKSLRHAPEWIAKEYEVWKELVLKQGPEVLREFPGYHDEQLKGIRSGQRSSRLNRQYRVIYTVDRDLITVYVLEVTPHRY